LLLLAWRRKSLAAGHEKSRRSDCGRSPSEYPTIRPGAYSGEDKDEEDGDEEDE